MWKESYKIGVENIDNQHFELFKMVDNLLKTINIDNNSNKKEEYKKALDFMRNYVIIHFNDEELYQAEINYEYIESHKKEHRDFINTIIEFEKLFKETDYDEKIVKKFAGRLTAWLIYHVADSDLKIVSKSLKEDKNSTENFKDYFLKGIADVFLKMFNIEIDNTSEISVSKNKIPGEIFIKLEIIGNCNKSIVFGFSKDITSQMIKIMMFMEIDKIDELVYSVLSEVSNIISGNSIMDLSKEKNTYDITTPTILNSIDDIKTNDKITVNIVNTKIGSLYFLLTDNN